MYRDAEKITAFQMKIFRETFSNFLHVLKSVYRFIKKHLKPWTNHRTNDLLACTVFTSGLLSKMSFCLEVKLQSIMTSR